MMLKLMIVIAEMLCVNVKLLNLLLKMTPPDLTSFKPKDIFGALEFAKHFAAKDELRWTWVKKKFMTPYVFTQ